VIGTLASRRGQVQSQEDRSGIQVINALVPLSEMLGYAADLRAQTSGRATFVMQLEGYQPYAGGPDDDRVSRVSVPRMPTQPGNQSAAAVPEPENGTFG
jgi:elongation factor G